MAAANPIIQQLREQALALFQIGVNAANPKAGLDKAFQDNPLSPLQDGRYLVIALGKAANAMATTCLGALPQDTPFEALVITNYENATKIEGATTFAAGHPVPDENGLAAGKAIIDLLATTTDKDKVIVLISGGGSALVPAPIDGISLEDKIAVNKLLLSNGYPIQDMNLIRQTLSQLKGGGLSQLARPAQVQSYILSDVVGDDLSVIASGPTNPPLGTAKDALALFEQKGLIDQLPANVRSALENKLGDQTKDLSNTTNLLIGSNRISLDAIFDAVPLGWRGLILDDLLEGDVEDIAPHLLAEISAAPRGEKTAYIWGGETTVTLKGDGLGGRNQELALRLAALAEKEQQQDGHWVFLSGGTDGRDGPTDSAGGLVDAQTLARIREQGADPEALLANNDSYKALALSGDHIMMSATGTNVADIQICLVDKT
ncbi:glycerate kinase type-2 family protein [Cohaesibacter celericrescens]|uniref:glycerate kinase type-2 family protein n=1 Tax=Cohaesibacter celericrescens TaxID=2067669 RepID=UPI00356510C0